LSFSAFTGFLVTNIPTPALPTRPTMPNSVGVYEAFQQGMINPVTLAVRNPMGHYVPFEDALISGLLYLKSSTHREGSAYRGREGSMSRGEMVLPNRSASMPPGGRQQGNFSYSYRAQTSQTGAPTMTRAGTISGPLPPGSTLPSMPPPMLTHGPSGQTGTMSAMNGMRQQHGSTSQYGGYKPGMGTLPLHPQADPHSPLQNAQSPLLNGNAHFVNGKLFASRPGFIIEGNGTVINMQTGEVISLSQAQKQNIIQQIPDDADDQAIPPPANHMFNRVSHRRK